MSDPVSPKPGTINMRTRLAAAVVPVVLLLSGYVASTFYFSSQERQRTLERLPEQPALDRNTRALAPVLEEAVRQVQETPGAAQVGHLGKLYQANYFYDEASACYARAMALDPNNAQWPYLLVYVNNMKGGGADDRALLDRAIELDPSYLPALLRRADNRYKEGDHAGAAADYNRCLDLDVSNPYARLGLGRVAADGGDWVAAEKQLRMAVDADSQFGTAYRLLATVYENLGKEEEQGRALAAADALGRFEASPDPWVDELEALSYHTDQLLTKGDRAEKIDQLDTAQSYYRRVLAIDPDDFVANAKLGTLLQGMERLAEAAPYLEKAVTLPPRSNLRLSELNMNLGSNYFRQRAPEKAVPYLQKALELDPTLEAAHRALAGCYLHLQRPQDAIAHCEKALALDPDSTESRFNMGQALLMMNDVEAALPHFIAAERGDPPFPPADFIVGSYYTAKGDRDRAAPHLERALETARASGNEDLARRVQAMLSR